ncbi:winged helix DNA-binding protein [Actinocorallia herbida]|uniref:Winged helix DNA-binding protein n=1 Tax=Actinocorallia herbida TaxID=58109 RepID=A0A3N1CX15_9ACTN|nr:winged helix DNA-binding domain-containing protein [Actinocorallia herbida]ROO85840.1 winged helix DNA-binding protein [Actinocorallia herbida]
MRVLDREHAGRVRAGSQAVGGGVRLDGPAGIVARVFALQAQDAGAAALGLRARGKDLSAADVEEAVARRELVRGWFMRGTLHLVPGADHRWLTALLGPVFRKAGARRLRELGLDEPLCERAERAMEGTLGARGTATRAELTEVLGGLGVDTSGQAPFHLIRRAALGGRIRFGPDRDGAPAFLLTEPGASPGDRWFEGDAAVGELARRYLRGHAPASLRDFGTWSGLPAAPVRRAWQALAASGEAFPCRVLDDDCLMPADRVAELDVPGGTSPDVRLLPAYDGYLVGYRSRQAAVRPEDAHRVWPGGGQIRATVLADGQAVGTWSAKAGEIELALFGSVTVPGEALAAERADVVRFLRAAKTR